MEAYLSNGRNPVTHNEFEQNIKNSELYSLLQANTFENIQTEFQPTENDSLFGYPSQDTELQYNPQMEENFMKPQIYDAREYETSLQ
ncbi:hypothetical protein TNCT_320961 [Trichonephila clavata]|uniref:Uncharacterized protein n=1 Tax=Trichonephila clavata TaxID=2740835 RepID=A0A8X6GPB0_TRICU|nr:hypothetical protein TNCT_320961 [Trichonephila clavata]